MLDGFQRGQSPLDFENQTGFVLFDERVEISKAASDRGVHLCVQSVLLQDKRVAVAFEDRLAFGDRGLKVHHRALHHR